MLSSVFVSGRLGEIIEEKTRYVEVDRVIPGPTGHYEVDRFPVRSMLAIHGPFMTQPVGTYICFKGRLEVDPRLGLIIVDEIDEIYVMPKDIKRV